MCPKVGKLLVDAQMHRQDTALSTTINQECKTTSGEWIEGVGLGNIHDIWNLMYHDMKALYTNEEVKSKMTLKRNNVSKTAANSHGGS